MATFRKIVKDVAADWVVEEEGVVEAPDIYTLAQNERQSYEAAGGHVTDGMLHDTHPVVGDRVTFMVHGPSLGEKHQVVLTSYQETVLL